MRLKLFEPTKRFGIAREGEKIVLTLRIRPLLFREKSRLLRLLAYKRARDGSTALTTFRGCWAAARRTVAAFHMADSLRNAIKANAKFQRGRKYGIDKLCGPAKVRPLWIAWKRLFLRETTEAIIFAEGSRVARNNASAYAFSPQSLTTLRGPRKIRTCSQSATRSDYCFSSTGMKQLTLGTARKFFRLQNREDQEKRNNHPPAQPGVFQ